MVQTEKRLKRNSYLISKAMRSFLTASILTMVVTQMNITVDGIMVSHLISPDALSGIHLFTPFEYALAAVYMLLCAGGMTLGAKYLGERNHLKFNQTLATSLVSILVCGVLFAVFTLTFGQGLFESVCHEERVQEYFVKYATVMLAFGGFHMLDLFYSMTISAYGNPKTVIEAVIIAAIFNAVLDYVFIAWFGLGIAGAAYATILAYLLNIVLHSKFMVERYRTAFSKMFSLFSLKSLKDNLVQGLSGASVNVVIMVFLLLLNSIVQAKQGADGLFALSVYMNIHAWGLMLVNGFGTSTLSVGSFLSGQDDFAGLRFLVNKSLKLVLGCLVAVFLLVELFPGVVTGIFGADTPELMSYANGCIRTCAWLIIPLFVCAYLSFVYQMRGNLILSPLVMCIFFVLLIPSLLVWSKLGGDGAVWYAFPMVGVLGFGAAFAATEVSRSRRPGLSVLTLLPTKSSDNSYDVSIKANIDAFKESLAPLAEYLGNSEIDDSLSKKINLCLEETMLNIVQNSGRKMENHFFDVRISIRDGRILAVLKDDGSPFDPVSVPEEMMGLGMTLIHGLCQKLEHKYMYGQNVTYMTWTL